MNYIDKVKVVGIFLMITGVLLMVGSTQVSEPRVEINEVGEFNFSYAESIGPTPAIGSYTSQNVSAEEVHKTYNISKLDDSTEKKIRTADEEGRLITDDFTIEENRFIVRFGEDKNNNTVVYSTQPNGILPEQVVISGFILLISGTVAVASMRGQRNLPDSIKIDESDSRWEFGLK